MQATTSGIVWLQCQCLPSSVTQALCFSGRATVEVLSLARGRQRHWQPEPQAEALPVEAFVCRHSQYHCQWKL